MDLLTMLGGEEGCRRLAIAFYERVEHDPVLRPLFPGKSLRCASEELAAFLVQLSGGDEGAIQYRWWLSIRESHARFTISEAQRVRWVELMASVLADQVRDEEDLDRLVELFERTSHFVVHGDEPEFRDDVIAAPWGQQSRLEQIVMHLEAGQDMLAISAARDLENRPGLLVGILARMGRYRREDLDRYILTAVQEVPAVRNARWNGRYLIHHVAGLGHLPAVTALLASGVNSNLEDEQRHTPLHRAASQQSNGMVAQALIEAGANVDAASNVTRSTPLHVAARFGAMEVAQALVAAGANLNAMDRQGRTARERAGRCRQAELALFLASLT